MPSSQAPTSPGAGLPSVEEPAAPKLVTLGQKYLSDVDLYSAEIKPVPWAIEGLLAEKDLAFFTGDGGIGKSYVLMELAIALTQGRPLFRVIPTTRAYKVLYLDCEMSDWATETRFQRMLRGEKEFRTQGNLRVIPSASFSIEDPVSRRELADVIRFHEADFVLIDSAVRTTSGDTNDSQTPNRILKVAQNFRARFGCGFVYIYHFRKRSREDSVVDNDLGQMISGNAGWRNAMDLHVAIQRKVSEPEGIIITPEKTRHADVPPPPFFATWEHDDPFDPNGPFRMVYLQGGSLSSREAMVLEVVTKAGQVGILPGQVADALNVSKKSVQRIGKKLKLSGLIEVFGPGNRPLWRAGGQGGQKDLSTSAGHPVSGGQGVVSEGNK